MSMMLIIWDHSEIWMESARDPLPLTYIWLREARHIRASGSFGLPALNSGSACNITKSLTLSSEYRAKLGRLASASNPFGNWATSGAWQVGPRVQDGAIRWTCNNQDRFVLAQLPWGARCRSMARQKIDSWPGGVLGVELHRCASGAQAPGRADRPAAATRTGQVPGGADRRGASWGRDGRGNHRSTSGGRGAPPFD